MDLLKTWTGLCDTYLQGCLTQPPAPSERVEASDAPSPTYAAIFARIHADTTAGTVPDVYSYTYSPDLPEASRKLLEGLTMLESRIIQLGPLSKRIRECAKANRTRGVLLQLVESANAAKLRDISEKLSAIRDIIGEETDGSGVVTAREAMAIGLETAQRESKEGDGIRTGWPTLDRHYTVTPGSLLTLGAATNVGKSTVIASWFWTMAQRGTTVGIVSVEDSYADFGVKLLAAGSRTDPSAIWSMSLSQSDMQRIGDTVSRSRVPLHFAWVMSRQLQTVLDRMEHMAAVCGCKAIAVDFLQAIQGPSRKWTKREEIDYILEALIAKAGQLRIGLVVASQLVRSSTAEDDDGVARKPGITALKESGTIENRSQCVVLLHRERTTDTTIHVRLAKVKRHSAGAEFRVARVGGNGLLYEIEERGDGW